MTYVSSVDCGIAVVVRDRLLNSSPSTRGPEGGCDGASAVFAMMEVAGLVSMWSSVFVVERVDVRGVHSASASIRFRPVGYEAAGADAQVPSCSRSPALSRWVPGG